MPVLAYLETENGTYRKNAAEVASYAHALAKQMGTTAVGVAFNVNDAATIAVHGITKILQVNEDMLATFNAQGYAMAIAAAMNQEKCNIAIIGSSNNAKYLAPLLAAKMQAGYASNIIALPESTVPFTVKRTAFSNKGFAFTTVSTENKVLGISSNAFGTFENEVPAVIQDFSPEVDTLGVASVDMERVSGKISIADADIVVSGGRGLKGPENWGMIEELADVLGAATACSKPVSDMGWRPHSEHVGQTGKPVACNLYIAIAISGAIQHLAGVSASKVKLVINIDPEAPFFKSADYGVVGDAFEVVPQLIEKLKVFKAQNA